MYNLVLDKMSAMSEKRTLTLAIADNLDRSGKFFRVFALFIRDMHDYLYVRVWLMEDLGVDKLSPRSISSLC